MAKGKKRIGGSGWGKLKKGQSVTDVSDLKVDDIILNFDEGFNAKNVMRVTDVDPERGIFKYHFVNPDNVCEKRLPDDRTQATWDFEVEQGGFFRPTKEKKAFCPIK